MRPQGRMGRAAVKNIPRDVNEAETNSEMRYKIL
jgi:hypothetical protein